ncbi:Pectate lyase superfamily protein [compost metagenome]
MVTNPIADLAQQVALLTQTNAALVTAANSAISLAQQYATDAGESAAEAVTVLAASVKTADLNAASTVAAWAYSAAEMQAIVDNAVPKANYTALRGYSGRNGASTLSVRITQIGIAGVFWMDPSDAVTADNGGTVIVDTVGRRWKRFFNGFIDPRWFGAVADGVADDTVALQATMNAIPTNGGAVFAAGRYKSNGVVTIAKSNICIHLEGAVFLIGDTGASATTVNGATGKVGFHFKEADHIQITGSAEFIGQGVVGTTSLLGVMFDNCDDVSCPAFMRFGSMALGRVLASCVRGQWGDAQGKDINGLQTFESPPTSNAGSIEVVSGCSWCVSGDVLGYDNEKPVRYMSVMSGAPDNTFCRFGASICEAVDTDPSTAHALALRSSVNCSYGPVIASGGSLGVLITQYPTDSAWSVDGNVIESVQGNSASTSFSVDAIVSQETTSPNPIGANTILAIDASCAGERGISVLSGTLTIGRARLKGIANRAVVVSADAGVAKLRIGQLQLDGPGATASFVSVGNGGMFAADIIDLVNGPSNVGGITAAIRYDPAFGSGTLQGVDIGLIRYRRNGSAGNFTYAYMDLTNGFESARIGSVDSSDLTAHTRFASDSFGAAKGRILAATTPTTGTYSVGSLLWNSVPAAAGAPGWVCVTAGTPGVWKAMAAVAA